MSPLALDAHVFVRTTATCPNLLRRRVVHISQATANQLESQFVQAVKVVRRVRDLERLEAEPPHRLENAHKVLFFLCCRVCIVEAQVAQAFVVACKAKVDRDSFGVANVQEAIGLRREPRKNRAMRRTQVLLTQSLRLLRIFARLVQRSEEALFKHRIGTHCLFLLGLLVRLGRWRALFLGRCCAWTELRRQLSFHGILDIDGLCPPQRRSAAHGRHEERHFRPSAGLRDLSAVSIHLATHDSHALSRRYDDADATVFVESCVVVQRVHRGRIRACCLDLVRRHEVFAHDAVNNVV